MEEVDMEKPFLHCAYYYLPQETFFCTDDCSAVIHFWAQVVQL